MAHLIVIFQFLENDNFFWKSVEYLEFDHSMNLYDFCYINMIKFNTNTDTLIN